jgi:hypothetical protein
VCYRFTLKAEDGAEPVRPTDDNALFVFFGICVVAVVFAVASAWNLLPEIIWSALSWDRWLGQGWSIWGKLASALAGVAATVAIFLLNRRTKAQIDSVNLARIAEIATRFQKGAEMLASEQEFTQIAGVAVLKTVADEDPETYYVPSVETLLGMLKAEKNIVENSGGIDNDLHRLDSAQLAAFEAIGSIRLKTERKQETDSLRRKLQIHRKAIGSSLITDGDFGDFFFFGCSFQITFERCDFTRARFYNSRRAGFSQPQINFRGCQLADVWLEADKTMIVIITDCSVSGASISGGNSTLVTRSDVTKIDLRKFQNARFSGCFIMASPLDCRPTIFQGFVPAFELQQIREADIVRDHLGVPSVIGKDIEERIWWISHDWRFNTVDVAKGPCETLSSTCVLAN